MTKPRNKRIPQFRALALANAFAVAASTGKRAKIIDAIHSARNHDKEFHTNFLGRIAREVGQEITTIKTLEVSDMTNGSGLKGRLHDAFKTLANEMEDAIQDIATHGNGDARQTLRRVAPAKQYRAGNGGGTHYIH